MQKTYQLQKTNFQMYTLLCIPLGMVFGIIPSVYLPILVSVILIRLTTNMKYYIGLSIGLIAASYVYTPNLCIIYTALVCVILLIHLILSQLHMQVFQGVFVGVCLAVLAYIGGMSIFNAFIHSIIFYALYYSLQEVQEVHIYVYIFIFSLYLVLSVYLPNYYLAYACLLLASLSFFVPYSLLFTCIIILYASGVYPIVLLYALFVNTRKQYQFLWAIGGFALLYFEMSLEVLLFVFVLTLMSMFVTEEDESVSQVSDDLQKSHQLLLQQNFYKQIMNFSNIFYDLGKYYEYMFRAEGSLLIMMSEALSYNAKICKQYIHVKETKQKRITQAIQGYKFNVLECLYEEDYNHIRVSIQVDQLFEEEIHDVILPLVEKICECKMKIRLPKATSFFLKKKMIVLESLSYMNVSIFRDEVALSNVNGDHSTTFQNENQSVCILSDGMGKGEQAHKISQLMIQIVEKLLRSDVPQVECVKLMNKFIHSDLYATLDILCFDQKNAMAYLSKSAAAPTYLYRNGQLFEISGSSLPIGIVENVHADVYQIPCFKEDIFIMVSDGVAKREIDAWSNLKRCNAIKNEGINFMNIVKQKIRKDDASIIMAKIQ